MASKKRMRGRKGRGRKRWSRTGTAVKWMRTRIRWAVMVSPDWVLELPGWTCFPTSRLSDAKGALITTVKATKTMVRCHRRCIRVDQVVPQQRWRLGHKQRSNTPL